ncbi:MAG: hypothetical protein QW265_01105 [Candidatus Bathyarchaeia archaeon]
MKKKDGKRKKKRVGKKRKDWKRKNGETLLNSEIKFLFLFPNFLNPF